MSTQTIQKKMQTGSRAQKLLGAIILALVLTITAAWTASAQTDNPPAKPTGLTGTLTHDSVTLTWDDPGDESITGYQILRWQRGVHEQGDFQVHVDDTGSAQTSYLDTDVQSEARYVYRIKARNTAGLSPQSSYFDVNLPAPPAVTVSFEQATYTVDEGENIVIGVLIDTDPERTITIPITGSILDGASDADHSGVPAEVIFNSGETRLTVTMTATDDAEDDDGESVVVSFGTMPDRVSAGSPDQATVIITDNDEPEPATDPPAKPTGLTGTVTHDSVTLSWDDPGDESITGYQILRWQRGVHDQGDFQVHVDDTGSAQTSYLDTDVQAEARYVYRVKARNTAGLSPQSSYFDVNLPAPPAVTVSFEQATHTVVESENITIAILLDTDPERSVTIPLTVSNEGGASESDHSGIPTDITFNSGETRLTITVTATDDAEDDDGESVAVSFGTMPDRVSAGSPDQARVIITDNDEPEPATDPPAKPTGLTGTVAHNQVSLLWDDLDDDSITGYQVLRRDTTVHELGEFITLVDDTGSASPSYTDNAVAAGTLYVYRVKARNAAGLSPPSSYFNALVPLPPTVTVSFEQTTYSVAEGESLAVSIVLDADPERAVTIPISVSNQGSTSDADYSGVPSEVAFNAGDTEQSFTLVATDDEADDDGESVTLAIGAGLPNRVSAGSPSQATVSITDNDEPAPTPTPEPVPVDSDTTRGGAIDLGDITDLDGTQFPKYEINGEGDAVDYFSFSLAEPMLVSLALRQLDFDADLSLEDGEGETIRQSLKSGTANEAITRTLLEGIYYIRVEAKETGENVYVLRHGVDDPDPDKVAELREKTESDNDNENGEVESGGLISNMAERFSDKVATYSGNTWAIRFTAGPGERAWTLAAVRLQIASWHDGVTPTVALHQAGTDGVPGDMIATMSNPGRGHGKKTFAAPAGVLLERNTAYTIVLSSDGVDAGSAVWYRSTNKNADNNGGNEGWSLADNSLHFSSGSWSSDRTAIKLAVVGAPLEARNALERKCLALDDSLSDPLYGCQWHLNNTGQFPGGAMQDINVEEVWASGNLGQGVNVALVDDGLDFRHDDLMENVLRSRNHSYTHGGVGDQSLTHGTSVAGIIAGRDNYIGGRGVAPRATVYVYQAPTNDSQRANAMSRHAADTAVSNNSWGLAEIGRVHFASAAWERAVEQGVTDGYGGKGVLYVWAAGNGGRKDYANLSEYLNHYTGTTVCAVNYRDVRSAYSEMGPNLWVCAPSGDKTRSLPGITTTESGDAYREDFGGTSAAAPIVSGVAALVRAANADLTWRDVKLILAGSARKNDTGDSGWEQGALEYGSTTERYSFNHEYGFGVVDAGAAVALADGWTNLPPLRTITAASNRSADIPDGRPNSEDNSALTSNVFVPGYVDFIEYVAIELTITHEWFRDLRIELESPAGATSILTVPADLFGGIGYFGSNPGQGSLDDETFRLGTAMHLGERGAGEWTLRIMDEAPGYSGKLHSWKLTAYGHGHSSGFPSIDDTTSGNKSITVTWAAPDETGGSAITGYDLRYIRSDARDKTDPANWNVAPEAWTSGALTHVLTGLDGGRRYDIQVRAVNGSGPGPWSQRFTGATAPIAPGLPRMVYLNDRDRELGVNWRPPDHDGGTEDMHYDVRYIRSDDSDISDDARWTVVSQAALGASSTYATIEGLENGVRYYVQVRAVNSVGPGPWSARYVGDPDTPN